MNCAFIRDDADEAKPFRCPDCGYRWRNDNLHRNCPARALPQQSSAIELTVTGKLLAAMRPGDGLAWLTKYTGIAAAWESVTKGECGCKNRQTWLNDQWARFVVRHFAISDSSTERVHQVE